MRTKTLATWALFPLLAAVGCGDDAETESEEERATRTVLVGADEEPPQVEGYDVVFASAGRPRRGAAEAEKRRQAEAREHLVLEPNGPDPHDGNFTLEQAVEGLPIDGQLVAEINTDLGTLFCDLHADRAPETVATFVGLARGLRSWWDARAGQWVRAPAYRMTKFHRVVPGFMIQGGDYLGDGSGAVGFTIPDELHETLRHDRAGQLCMANTGPNTNGAQFFVTDGAAPHLDGSFTIFGQCRPTDVIERIARVPQSGAPDNRPLTDVVIERVLIRRVEGGAEQARRSPPQLPEGFDPEVPARGASPGPHSLEQQIEERRRLAEESGRLPENRR